MNLNIENPNINKSYSKEKKYGNLIIETSNRDRSGIIDLSKNNSHNTYIKTTSNNNNYNNTSANNNYTNSSISNNSSVNKRPKTDKSIANSINKSKSISIKKGEKLSLDSLTPNLNKLIVGLDWYIDSSVSSKLDLDVSIFMVDINGNTSEENFIFYGNPESRDKSVSLGKDHNSLLCRGYDSTIQLNLDSVESTVQKLALTVTIYEAEKSNLSFRYVSNGFLRLIDTSTKTELINYKFTENLNLETALVVCEIYRYKGQWKVSPIGSGFFGGLKALCDNYGVETK